MLIIGQHLQERYQIVALLGQGGMGAVYRAYDSRLNKACVVKQMLNSVELMANPIAAADQFKREAQVLASLEHPNLPRVSDYFSDGGSNYLVMDFVDGQNLHRLIGESGLPEATVLNYANQLLDALEYIHAQGIVHRDIKPANILIRNNGRAMLVDFGLVKVITPGAEGTNTFMRGVGTPEFAPPEQMKGGTDQRSDIYSLGATLYHALTGRSPLDAMDRSMQDMPAIRQINPAVSERTERVVMQALMMQPAKRWQSASEMRLELTGARAAPPLKSERPSGMPSTVVMPRGQNLPDASPPPPAPAPAKQTPLWQQRRAQIGALVGGAALILIAALALRSAPQEPTRVAAIATAPPAATVTLAPTSTATRAPTSTIAPTKTPTPTPTPSPTPVLNEIVLTLRGGVTMRLVRVPAGEFLMGSTDSHTDAESDEKPQHTVRLNEYWIGKTEVTNAQFEAFVEATLYTTTAEIEGWAWAWTGSAWDKTEGANWRNPQGPKSSISGKKNHPVVSVSWDDAVAFCAWVSKVSGKHVRLPTEAEWEKAARGPSTALGMAGTYPWGDAAPNGRLLNYADKNLKVDWADKEQDDGYETSAPVGSYPSGASPYGALDMAGNVWEWTSSLDKPYPYIVDDGREAQRGSEARVLRGGGFGSFPGGVRAAIRFGDNPNRRSVDLGFRIVAAPLASEF